jgi:hypothetical protein
MAWSHISTIDARRVSVMVNSIPSAVILCTQDRGSVASSIEMRGRERARSPAGDMVVLAVIAMVVLEERLGEEMMKKKLNRRFLIY